jgi:hypothetical protein
VKPVKQSLRNLTSAILVRVACWVGLLALLIMAWPLFVPRTVPVLVSMSAGQGLGAFAFLCYLGSILLEVRRHEQVERVLVEEEKELEEARRASNARASSDQGSSSP